MLIHCTKLAVLRNFNKSLSVHNRSISCTSSLYLDQKWREINGLPINPNSAGPLTDLPDYTFLDGRPTPLGSRQKQRLIKQQEYTRKIIALSGELDFAKERFAQITQEKEDKHKKILENQFKRKGHLLLRK